MKSIIINSVALFVVGATLLAFAPNLGGEGFEISLNNKMLIQKYGASINDVNSLELDQTAINGQLTVNYHHCGRVGKNRVICIKDRQDKVVKEWRFADGNGTAAMNFSVKDIVGLRKANNNFFKMYYSSSELPNGRLLTSIVLGNSLTKK